MQTAVLSLRWVLSQHERPESMHPFDDILNNVEVWACRAHYHRSPINDAAGPGYGDGRPGVHVSHSRAVQSCTKAAQS
jgi:hypothetical protein